MLQIHLGRDVEFDDSRGGEVVGAANYTIAETVSAVDGLKRVSYETATGSEYASRAVNVTYTYGPEGYIDSSGARSVAGLIAIIAALAIMVFALTPTMREKLLGVFGK